MIVGHLQKQPWYIYLRLVFYIQCTHRICFSKCFYHFTSEGQFTAFNRILMKFSCNKMSHWVLVSTVIMLPINIWVDHFRQLSGNNVLSYNWTLQKNRYIFLLYTALRLTFALRKASTFIFLLYSWKEIIRDFGNFNKLWYHNYYECCFLGKKEYFFKHLAHAVSNLRFRQISSTT